MGPVGIPERRRGALGAYHFLLKKSAGPKISSHLTWGPTGILVSTRGACCSLAWHRWNNISTIGAPRHRIGQAPPGGHLAGPQRCRAMPELPDAIRPGNRHAGLAFPLP